MEIKKYLTEQIKKVKHRMNLARLMDYGVIFAAAGGIAGMCCEFISLFWQFYYVHLAAGLCFGAGFLIGIGCAVHRRADMKQAARRIDSFGLKERMITAYENMGEEDEFARLQRQDAQLHYKQIHDQIKIPLLPDKRHILALFVSVVAVLGMSFIPSPVREQAKIRHQVQEEAGEEQTKLKELLEAMEGVDQESLTEEQKSQFQELMESMELSREELAESNSWESLAAAVAKLDYKYQQAAQSLENLAARMENPAAAGVASAEALAKAAANQSGQQPVSSQMAASSGASGTSGQNSGDDVNKDGEGGNHGSSAEGQGEGNGSGENNDQKKGNGSGQGSGNSSGSGNGNGSGKGGENGSGNSQGQGNGSGSGNGQGQGNGSGSGNGQGQGNGSGNGSGMGSGRGTGSSDTAHDYVSIPNATADDPALTGNKNGDQNSDYYRQQNGLAWEGDHVDYSSVIGEYADSAYEGIANGKYPDGMESVIRDYFENLNK